MKVYGVFEDNSHDLEELFSTKESADKHKEFLERVGKFYNLTYYVIEIEVKE